MNKVLILGGYGNFGKRIANLLTRQKIHVIIAGRSKDKALQVLNTLNPLFCEIAIFDANTKLIEYLEALKPKVVINTCGPFQNSDYRIAQECINHGVHYIDLADGRDFVRGISILDTAAKNAGVAVISGASSVPGLSSAVIEEYCLKYFSRVDTLQYGISPGQNSERGVATTAAILSYVGKKLRPCGIDYEERYGWQDLYIQKYPEIGRRWMANCDIPDLDLLPQKYGIKKIRFSAGIENSFLHLGMWFISWFIRLGLPVNLPKYAGLLLKTSNLFNFMGSSDGGMHMIISGIDKSGKQITKKWFIIALDGDGPYIPTIPSVVIAKKVIADQFDFTGAASCVGLVTLDEYLKELGHLKISIREY